MKIEIMDGIYAVGKLDGWPQIGQMRANGSFCAVTVTADETSLVCEQDSMPPCSEIQTDFVLMRVAGALDFSLTGILAGISDALAKAQVSIFCISTYNTDYIMVRAQKLERAVKALKAAGYEVRKAQ